MDKIAEFIKNVIAFILNYLGFVDLFFNRCYKDCQVIRVINYHRTPAEELKTFEKQLQWYQKRFQNIDKNDFVSFMNGNLKLEKPGIILSFDDGLKNNYEYATPLLERYGFTGWFFVSSGLVNKNEYMTFDDIRDLLNKGAVIGCHTYTHHRMNKNDTNSTLQYEIVDAKSTLEKNTSSVIDIFCWCGGESDTYTKPASDLIRAHYRWGFMTNSDLVKPQTDHYQLQRTNVEARWPLSTAKFQLCGIMDRTYRSKREAVNRITAAD